MTNTRSVSAFRDDALAQHDAVALAAMVAAGEVSPLELVDAAIARSEAVDPALNAVSVRDDERARTTAQTDDLSGVFAGVPSYVKALTGVAGLPNRFGSRAVPDTPVEESSPTVTQLESTGVINLGLTTTPEFGLTATTEPALTGITRNPWSLDHSPGGSSGGAAAVVAAGVVPIAHANDGGGSIRIPAACCGLVGLKPSRGRIQREPLPKVFPLDIAIDGIVSRSVRDTAAFMHGAEQHAPVATLPPVGHVEAPLDQPLRIGMISERIDGSLFDSANRAELARVGSLLEDLGHHVEPISNPFPASTADDFITLWALLPFLSWYGGERVMGPGWNRDELEPWTKWLARHFRRNAVRAPAAFRRLRRLSAGYSTYHDDYDVFFSSTLGGPVHEIGHLSTDLPGEVHLARVLAQVPTTPMSNATGGAAISLPLGRDADGLPMGMHFAADVGQEAMLLGLALQLEEASPWPTLA